MVKIGLIGGTSNMHGYGFSAIINGFEPEIFKAEGWWQPSHRLEIATVTKVWDENISDAKNLADICKIEKVVDSVDDMTTGVDAVIICDDMTFKHQRHAKLFLEKGIPTFVDKPLSPDIAEAEDILNIARRTKTVFMSSSALRFAKEVEELKDNLADLGNILSASVIGPDEMMHYGIHPIEMIHTVLGPGIKSVYNIGMPGKDLVRILYKDGRTVMLQVIKDVVYLFQFTLYGDKDWKQIHVEDASYFYYNMLKAFIKGVEDGVNPIPLDSTLEVIKATVLSIRSLKGGRELFLT